MRTFAIAGRPVGDGHPCFIIAEAGSNHDGDLRRAFQLVDIAADSGADAVKFQTFRAKNLYPRTEVRPRYLRKLGIKKTIYQTIADMEMPFEWLKPLAARCKKRGIQFMSTPFDEECADRMNPFVPAYKIASYEMTHIPLLRHVAAKRKPLIISTGAATLAEIDRAFAALRRGPIALMQCTAKYPAPPESMNLLTIPAMKRRYGIPVGLSDHSATASTAAVAAVVLGANLLEKHFTVSRSLKGPDHSYAIEPDDLHGMIRAVRDAEKMAGDGVKRPHPVERELREYRRGLFTLSPVGRGERFTAANVGVLRRGGKPETSLRPEHYPSLLGRRAARELPAHHLLSRSDVAR